MNNFARHLVDHTADVAEAFPLGKNQNYIVIGAVGAGKSALIRTAMHLLNASGEPPESGKGGVTHTRKVTAYDFPNSSLRLIDCPGLEDAAQAMPLDVWGAILAGGLKSGRTEVIVVDNVAKGTEREWRDLGMTPGQQDDSDKLDGVVICIHGPSALDGNTEIRNAALAVLKSSVRLLKRAREFGCTITYAVTQCDSLPGAGEPASMLELDKQAEEAIQAVRSALRAFGAPDGHIIPCISYPGAKDPAVPNHQAEASVLELLRALDRDPPAPAVMPIIDEEPRPATALKLTAAIFGGSEPDDPPIDPDDVIG